MEWKGGRETGKRGPLPGWTRTQRRSAAGPCHPQCCSTLQAAEPGRERIPDVTGPASTDAARDDAVD